MLARREALESAGYFDEHFFMYSDETDLCRRIKLAGWEIRHLPQMTILHHDRKAGIKPHIESLGALTRMWYARKYFSPVHRVAYRGAVMLRHVLRAVYSGSGEVGSAQAHGQPRSWSARCSGASRCRSPSSPARCRSRPAARSCATHHPSASHA